MLSVLKNNTAELKSIFGGQAAIRYDCHFPELFGILRAVKLPVMSEIASLTQSARQSAIARFQVLQPHLE